MKYWHFVYILIIGVLITTISILYRSRNNNESQINLYVAQNIRMDNYYKFLKFKDKEMYLSNGTILSPELILIDENDKSFKFSDLVTSNSNVPKIVIRLSAVACDICLDEELKIIKGYISIIGTENIMIFASSYNLRSLKVRKNNLLIDIPIYQIEETGIQFEANHTNLFVFTINSDFTVKDFFIPEKSLPEISNDYYDVISKKYW